MREGEICPLNKREKKTTKKNHFKFRLDNKTNFKTLRRMGGLHGSGMGNRTGPCGVCQTVVGWTGSEEEIPTRRNGPFLI